MKNFEMKENNNKKYSLKIIIANIRQLISSNQFHTIYHSKVLSSNYAMSMFNTLSSI